MPRLSVWFLRAGLVQLALGFTLGALMLWNMGIPFDPAVWRLLPLHIELVLIGWTVQLVMGVEFWILPRYPLAPERGREWPAWLAFALINLGVALAGSGGWLGAPSVVIVAGRAAEAGAGLSFVLHAWGRVRPLSLGSKTR